MLTLANAFNTLGYILKCALASGLIMFICMAAGELLVDPQMFRGFLAKPRVWFFILLESTIWMIPMALLSLPFLWSLKRLKESATNWVVVSGWAALGISAIIVYKTVYFPNEWALDQITRADITFGWTIPCVVILVVNGILSLQYIKLYRNMPDEQ